MDVLRGLVSLLESGVVEIQSGVDQFWLWLQQAFLIPGSYILERLVTRAPELAVSLGLNSEDITVVWAGVISAVTWLVAAFLVKAVCNIARDLLESMTYSVRRFAEAALHRVRMIRLRLLTPLRKLAQRFRGGRSVHLEEFDIDDLQLAILRAQSRLAPGQPITAVDIASEFGVGRSRAQQALDALRKLHLVEVSFGTTGEFPGYLLTRPGEVFISAGGLS
jgi:hypothetical protein